ncbi:Clp protease N-terminal domain-containing protein (plasmid) [Pseudarthrobacter sp. P1]|uniref:Clp protease N-terminal domain-containing protein n=1 Tax=Pseudarthrobacter sp. P1 TaxID=3418418 RepID=UPI003CF59939
MFEKFTPDARRIVALALEEARGLNHRFIHTDHLLIALSRDDGLAGEALGYLCMGAAALQDLATGRLGGGTTAPAGHIPFSGQVYAVFERAHELHLRLGHPEVGPEHILLAMTTLDNAIAPEIYSFFDTTEAQLQESVARQMVTGVDSSGPAGPFSFRVRVDSHGTVHGGSASATNSRKAEFTLHPGELFSVSEDGTIDENARFLDYTAAARAAAESYGEVVILTSHRKDIDALDRHGNRIKVGEVTVWTPEPIHQRLVFLD